MQLLMKNRTRYYGRNFCGNIEMECIVKCALTSWAEYRPIGPDNKRFPHSFRIIGSRERAKVTPRTAIR
jgi:hypothetical protein